MSNFTQPLTTKTIDLPFQLSFKEHYCIPLCYLRHAGWIKIRSLVMHWRFSYLFQIGLVAVSTSKVISWLSALLAEKTGAPGGNRQHSASNWHTSQHAYKYAVDGGMHFLERCFNHICHRGPDGMKAASFKSGQADSYHLIGHWHTTGPGGRLPFPKGKQHEQSSEWVSEWMLFNVTFNKFSVITWRYSLD